MESPEIPDSLPADFPEGAGGAPEGPQEGGASPYRNLLVPLIVVPAMIVMVLVLVWVLFGALAGEVKGPTENLQRMVEGSTNERDQASQQLVAQIYAYMEAVAEGREPEWDIDATFLPALQSAWEDTDTSDAEHLFVIAFCQRQLGDEEGLTHLIDLLDLSESDDGSGRVRFLAARAIGVMAPVYTEREALLAIGSLTPILERGDAAMRVIAAAGLQGFAHESAREALRGALGDARLDVRGSAAISLAVQKDPAGAAVLAELLDPEAYAAEHAQDPKRWFQAERISQSRQRAVHGLARLGRPEDLALLSAAEAREDDPNVLAEIKSVLLEASGG